MCSRALVRKPSMQATMKIVSVHCTLALKSPNHKIDKAMIMAGAAARNVGQVSFPSCEKRCRLLGLPFICTALFREAHAPSRVAIGALADRSAFYGKEIRGEAPRTAREARALPNLHSPYCSGRR